MDWFASQTNSVLAALKMRAHNCGPLAHLAQAMLEKLGLAAKIYEEFAGANHAIVICSDVSLDDLPSDMKSWPDHVYVLDAQFNIRCRAAKYHTEIQKCMHELERMMAEIFHDEIGEWVRPTDSRWIDGLIEVPDWD